MPAPPLPPALAELVARPNPSDDRRAAARREPPLGRHLALVGGQDDTGFEGIDRCSRRYTGADTRDRDRDRVNAWIEVDSWHARDDGRPWTG